MEHLENNEKSLKNNEQHLENEKSLNAVPDFFKGDPEYDLICMYMIVDVHNYSAYLCVYNAVFGGYHPV